MKFKHYNKTALIYEDKRISYKELFSNIGSCSNFIDSGVNKAALFCENRPEWIYALFAIWSKGALCIPVDTHSDESELTHILSDSKPQLLFVSKENFKLAKEAVKNTDSTIKLVLIEELEKGKSKEFELKEFKKEDDALILYTSGTTGKPKGVVLSFKNLFSNINSIEKTKIVTAQDRVISLLPFHHSYPLMTTLLTPLYFGSTICIVKELSSEIIIKTLQENRVTLFVGVPRLFDLFHSSIMDKIESNLFASFLFKLAKMIDSKNFSRFIFKKLHNKFGGSIEYFISGGAKLDSKTSQDFKILGFDVIEGYGLTETSPIISFNPPTKIKIGSCGKVIDNVSVKFEDGEILVRGDNVTKGYYKLSEKTKEAIKEGWFYTGDLGEFDKEGYLYITGRKKDMIVLPSGKNINPEEIENNLLKTSPYIKEAGVLLKDNHLFALIYPEFNNLKDTVNITETIKWEVVDAYNLKAPGYKKITGFKVVNEELPKTRLGKIKHFLLPPLLKDEKKKSSKEEPTGEIYKILKEYLQGVSSKTVDPKDNIEIDLGLDSLAKIELLSFIDLTFGLEIEEAELSQNLSVEKLYEFIKEQNTKIDKEQSDWKKILIEDNNIKPELLANNIIVYLSSLFLNVVSKIYFRLEITGKNRFPKKPFLIVPNHQSLLDGPLLMGALPNEVLKDTYFLMDETFFESEVLRKYVNNKSLHLIAINKDLNLKNSMQMCAAFLKEGKNVVIFPEGARTRDGELMEFKKLFAILAKNLQVPIVPVVIKGAFKAYSVKDSFPKPAKITIEFLEAVESHASVEEITQNIKELIGKKL